MPTQAPRICARCRRVVPAGQTCDCRPSFEGTQQRGHGRKWSRYRLSQLKAHPICQHPGCRATEVDHRIPSPRAVPDSTSPTCSRCAPSITNRNPPPTPSAAGPGAEDTMHNHARARIRRDHQKAVTHKSPAVSAGIRGLTPLTSTNGDSPWCRAAYRQRFLRVFAGQSAFWAARGPKTAEIIPTERGWTSQNSVTDVELARRRPLEAVPLIDRGHTRPCIKLGTVYPQAGGNSDG